LLEEWPTPKDRKQTACHLQATHTELNYQKRRLPIGRPKHDRSKGQQHQHRLNSEIKRSDYADHIIVIFVFSIYYEIPAQKKLPTSLA
jgi:hypothetical protein